MTTDSRSDFSRRRLVRVGGLGLVLGALPLMTRWAEAQESAGGRVLDLAERRRDELVALLTALVATRSHSGETAADAQAIVTEYLTALDYRVERSEDVPSRLATHPEFMPPSPAGDGPFVNVVGRPRADGGAAVGVFAHIDTEAPGSGWETDPYTVSRSGGRLHGLGCADDKGGVAAMLVAAAILRDLGGPLPTVMSLHGKGGGCRGSLPVFERFARQGESFGAVLYSHPAETGRGLVDIKHVVQGSLDLTLRVDGWRGEPLEIGSPESAPFASGGDALQACWDAIAHLRANALAGHHVNVGEMSAGDRVGAVPESASARIRVLFEGHATWRTLFETAQAQLRDFLDALPTGGGRFSGVLTQQGLATNPGAVAWDEPASRDLRAAITDVTGTPPQPYRNHYAGDIRFPIRLLGAPSFGIGSVGGNFYGPNEWVDEADLVRLTAVIVDTVRRWSAR